MSESHGLAHRNVPACIAFLGILLVATASAAQTPRTVHVSTAGDDAAECTKLEPCRSLSRGQALASPGDTVEVEPGVYVGKVTLTKSGTANSPITYRGHSESCPTITNKDPACPSHTPGAISCDYRR